MSAPLEGHNLKRASADCYLCGCGFGIFGARDQREATQRHGQHLTEVRAQRTRTTDAQKEKRQADFADAQEPHWSSPFRRGVLGQ